MRQITFRGKRIDNGKWVYGNLIQIRGRYHINAVNRNGQVVPDTIGQFTGLTDKEAHPIYEGDILEFNDCVDCSGYEYADAFDTVNRAVVGFADGAFTLTKYRTGNADTEMREWAYKQHDDFVYAIEHDAVIVGNIHDNPEIMNEWRRDNARDYI